MANPFALIDIAALGGGVFLGVYFHDTILKYWQGAEAFAANLKTKAASIEAQIASTTAAVKNSVK